jgi:hypothetical protein
VQHGDRGHEGSRVIYLCRVVCRYPRAMSNARCHASWQRNAYSCDWGGSGAGVSGAERTAVRIRRRIQM